MITAMREDDRDRGRDPLTERIIAACYQVHNELGPGFVERIYLSALKVALKKLELKYEEEKEFEVSFQGEKIGKFRTDLVVENKVIVELKALEVRIPKIFESQVISYLKASGLSVGLLVNFGNRSCEIRRLMNHPDNHRNL
ncbi:MAG: GxxExxY protein [Chloroflexi bacterium]|nr:GxxExxY protein [Chloroflexota bacterium]